ncbi:MAG: UDP-N-acetylmuramoyl-L-alanyl-D-glutamate--2,6-diaminopimelate ligase, partial [Geobacteraceae bacterium]|nr:UDP-N-acetylmuramoyl-L-alanyl-D-glutamate--2,6-diaminopimelate ligase [Geobacteraceae bacterium]
MTLHELLKNLPDSETHGNMDVCINSLTCDSRAAQPGALFFALRGSQADGHSYINKAVEAGATAVILEDAAFAPAGLPWVRVTDGRAAMGSIAAHFNGDPTA